MGVCVAISSNSPSERPSEKEIVICLHRAPWHSHQGWKQEVRAGAAPFPVSWEIPAVIGFRAVSSLTGEGCLSALDTPPGWSEARRLPSAWQAAGL